MKYYLIIFCLLLVGLCSQAVYAQHFWDDLDDFQKELYYKIVNEESIEFSDSNYLFIGGLSSFLLNSCTLNIEFKEEIYLNNFVQNCEYFSKLTGMNCEIKLNTTIDRAQILKKGLEVGKILTCKQPYSTNLAISILSLLKRKEINSNFIKSCIPYQGKEKCICLSKIAMSIYPDIHNRTYDYDIVNRITTCNIVTGIQVLWCGIDRY